MLLLPNLASMILGCLFAAIHKFLFKLSARHYDRIDAQLAVAVQALDVNRVSVIPFPNLVGSKGVLRDYPAHCQPIGLRFGGRFLRGLSGELRAYGPLSLSTY